jgi:hypothetical protein
VLVCGVSGSGSVVVIGDDVRVYPVDDINVYNSDEDI